MKSKLLNKYNFLFVTITVLLMITFGVGFAQQHSSVPTEAFIQDTVQPENDNFTYSSRGRRDPFKPLVQVTQEIVSKVSGRANELKGPLEKFELSQFRLVALMVVGGNPRAMVKGPDGKGYTVKVGEYIGLNDGLVKKIETKIVEIDNYGMRIEKSPDRIIVEEVGIDSLTGKEVRENRYIVM